MIKIKLYNIKKVFKRLHEKDYLYYGLLIICSFILIIKPYYIMEG